MWSEVVVDPDSFLEFTLCAFLIWQTISQIKFIFKSSVNPFCYSIFIRIMLCSHADPDIVFFKSFNIVGATVLEAAVGVVYQRPVGVFAVFNCSFKRVYAVNSLEVI